MSVTQFIPGFGLSEEQLEGLSGRLRLPGVEILLGDVRERLQHLEPDSIDCVVTSPPYWGLRDYDTGAWEGGDPDCPHLYKAGGTANSTLHVDPRNALSRETNAEQLAARSAGAATYLDRCKRCGALRVDDQIGLEPTPWLYLEHLVEVFDEVWRVLAPHGTLWLNLGDTYAAKTRGSDAGWEASRLTNPGGVQKAQAASLRASGERHRGKASGLREKNLVGIPWLVAFALQAAGWELRADVIWSKKNPMPESVSDRPTKSHEYVFLFTKRVKPHYWVHRLDGRLEMRRPRPEWWWWPPVDEDGEASPELVEGWVRKNAWRGRCYFFDQEAAREPHKHDGRRKTRVVGGQMSLQHRDGERWPNGGRNVRTVWEIATQPFKGAHFATFPEELVRRCLTAGCPTAVCRTCGKPREAVTAVRYENPENRSNNGTRDRYSGLREKGVTVMASGRRLEKVVEVIGATDCGHDDYRPAVVLDPFLGSGTTAKVALELGHQAVGVELSRDYAEIALRRLGG